MTRSNETASPPDSPSRTDPSSTARRSFLRRLGGASALAVATLSGTGVAAAVTEGDVPATLPSAIRLDRDGKAVTLPMYRGLDAAGRNVFFVITDATAVTDVTRRGINWSPKLLAALDTPAVQRVSQRFQSPWARTQSPVTFDATPDFDPAGETGPPAVAEGGYTPLVTPDAAAEGERVVYNAPHVANWTGRHPDVIRFDRDKMEVRLRLTEGFYEGTRVLFTTLEASTSAYATLGSATYAPALAAAPAPGDRSIDTSARESVFVVTNGPLGANDPNRQGLRSAERGEGDPLDVLVSNQVCPDTDDPVTCSVTYSPLLDVHEVRWTVPGAERTRLTSHETILARYAAGDLTSTTPDGPANPLLGNVPAAGILTNRALIDAAGLD